MDSPEELPPPRFSVGQVVRHRRYGYRGVIFGLDPVCTAPEAWYQKNQTQPERKQPWYHVMVHDHGHTTYVAQSNLRTDESSEPIVHPWLDKFFTNRVGGRYVRESSN